MMSINYILIAVFILVSCGPNVKRTPMPTENNEPIPEPRPIPSPDTEKDVNKKAAMLKKRLMSEYVEQNGYFSNMRKSKKLVEQEKAAYFSLVSFAALTCQESQKAFDAIELSIKNRVGAVVRFDPIPEACQAGQETDLGIERQFMAGMSSRLLMCADNIQEVAKIKDAWKLHSAFLIKNSFELYPNMDVYLSDGDRAAFLLVNELMGAKTFLSSQLFESYLLAETKRLTDLKTGGDALHDLYSMAIGIEDAGGQVTNKDALCVVVKDVKNPSIEKWCGKDQGAWLKSYKTNQYIFKNHNCFEQKPDLPKGSETSALDFLLVYRKNNR